jgi:hypothetical protein
MFRLPVKVSMLLHDNQILMSHEDSADDLKLASPLFGNVLGTLERRVIKLWKNVLPCFFAQKEKATFF